MTNKQISLLPVTDGDTIDAHVARGGRTDATLHRYAGPARSWVTYCLDRGEKPYDASTATLLRWLESRLRRSSSPASILKISVSAARWYQRSYCALHEVEAVPYSPRARLQLDAFVRSATLSKRPPHRARALRLDQLAHLVRHIRGDVRQWRGVDIQRAHRLMLRDVAMVLFGWWGAMRCDDLARMTWDGIVVVPEGVEVHIRDSKTGAAVIGLARRDDCPELCPRRAITHWGDTIATLSSATATVPEQKYLLRNGPVFGLGRRIGPRVALLFRRAGVPKGFTGHSLRAGFATEAASQGVPDLLIQEHGRWQSTQQLKEYVRLGRLWLDTPTSRIQLTGL